MQPPGIHPLSTYLLLDVTPQEQTTAAGIVLPTAVQGASTRMEAVIVGRGPDCARAGLTCGTQVYVGKYASGELARGGRGYRLAQEADIIATLDSVSPAMPEARVTPSSLIKQTSSPFAHHDSPRHHHRHAQLPPRGAAWHPLRRRPRL